MSTEDFFASPQGAAVMKHAVLGRYIRLFVNKLGSTHATVHYLDGYAGPGVYADGSGGSPKLAADVAALVEDIRDLRCTFVEKDPAHAAALAELLAQQLPGATVIEGDLQDHVDAIANDCDANPLLAFIDPFGLALPFEQLKRLVARTSPKTDIIMNVSLSALRRVGGHLTATSDHAPYLKAQATTLDRYDAVMGGDWWRQVYLDAKAKGVDPAIPIAAEYARKCQELRGGYFLADVKDRWDGPPAYQLLLLAGHPDAFWGFNEFMSKAYDALRELDAQGTLLTYEDEYPPILKANVRAILKHTDAFVVQDQLSAVYGSLLGIARETHLRKVIKSLVKEGIITTRSQNAKKQTMENGQGIVQRMVIKKVKPG